MKSGVKVSGPFRNSDFRVKGFGFCLWGMGTSWVGSPPGDSGRIYRNVDLRDPNEIRVTLVVTVGGWRPNSRFWMNFELQPETLLNLKPFKAKFLNRKPTYPSVFP